VPDSARKLLIACELGRLAYQVINRVAGRQRLVEDADGYTAFQWVLAEAREREGLGVCAYAPVAQSLPCGAEKVSESPSSAG
jgi:hypothetical protein